MKWAIQLGRTAKSTFKLSLIFFSRNEFPPSDIVSNLVVWDVKPHKHPFSHRDSMHDNERREKIDLSQVWVLVYWTNDIFGCRSFSDVAMFFTKRALAALLGLLFALLANQIVPTDQIQIFPEGEKDQYGIGQHIIEAGSTLLLTCVEELHLSKNKIRWIIPRITQRKEVTTKL